MKNQLSFILIVSVLLLTACSTKTVSPTPGNDPAESSNTRLLPEKLNKNPIYKSVEWPALTGWGNDDFHSAWQTFLRSCTVLSRQSLWKETCEATSSLQNPTNVTIRNFFETYFSPYQVINIDDTEDGLITGFYEPLLKGSRKPSKRYRYPLHATPDGLLVIDLGATYPEIKDLRLRGRLDGRKIIPYYTRAEIINNPEILSSYEFLWVEDEVELFFLHIQGSGRIILENGETIKVGYADQNGHPYNSIGSLLIQRGELSLEDASMQGIKQWGRRNPHKLPELLQQNTRYIFFRELPADLSGPIGALGVPLTAGRSIAIDPLSIPQGVPVYLATTWPNTDKPLNRLMVAQDVGSAIKGRIRADFFWGFGKEAENQAGKMKQTGKMWILMPHGYSVSASIQQ